MVSGVVVMAFAPVIVHSFLVDLLRLLSLPMGLLVIAQGAWVLVHIW